MTVNRYSTRSFHRDSLQTTQSENRHQSKLLPLGQLKRLEHRHRIDQDQEIGQDMDGRVGEPECLLAKAEARHFRIPELGKRDAIRPGAGNRPCSVHGEEADENGAGQAHTGC